MIIKKFVFNIFAVNTYVVYDETTKEAFIIDPGCGDDQERNELKEYIANNNLSIKYVVNTHCHIDHILGNYFIKETYNPELLVPEKDLYLLNSLVEQASNFGLVVQESPQPDKYLTEQLEFKIGNLVFNFIFTPGHTEGEYCLINYSNKICFTGDVLFFEGIGRTDLIGGNYDSLLESIREKLLSLDDDVKIYPGHGENSTIGYERIHNQYLNEI